MENNDQDDNKVGWLNSLKMLAIIAAVVAVFAWLLHMNSLA